MCWKLFDIVRHLPPSLTKCTRQERDHNHKAQGFKLFFAHQKNKALMNFIYDLFVTKPLWSLFRYGPMVSKFVPMYGNITDEAMCARLSGVPESTWRQIPHECEDLIQREFTSWQVLFTFCAYIYTLYRISCIVSSWLTPRPPQYLITRKQFEWDEALRK